MPGRKRAALAVVCAALGTSCLCNPGTMVAGPERAKAAVAAFHISGDETRLVAYHVSSEDLVLR